MTHRSFSRVEDHLLTVLCVKYGPQWAKISISFQNRNQLKQRWSLLRAQLRPFPWFAKQGAVVDVDKGERRKKGVHGRVAKREEA
jgi:hypothetical protein